MNITVYVPNDKKQMVARARQALERKGSNLSEFFVKQMESIANIYEREWELEELIRLKAKYESNKCL